MRTTERDRAIHVANNSYRNQESIEIRKCGITALNPVVSVWDLQEEDTKMGVDMQRIYYRKCVWRIEEVK